MPPTGRMRSRWRCAAASSGSEGSRPTGRESRAGGAAGTTRISDRVLRETGAVCKSPMAQTERMAVPNLVVALPSQDTLPLRPGPRPRTPDVLPAIQLDQWPDAVTIHRLWERAMRLPNVRARQSRMALPTAKALYIPDADAQGPREAFIDGCEFCHLHAAPEGSIHLTLPP